MTLSNPRSVRATFLAIAAISCMAINPALAGEKQCPKGDVAKSGTIEATIKTVGFIIGARWGEGTITLNDGTTHKIHLSGAKLLETGASEETLKGEILNLTSLDQFEGDYGAIEAGLTIGTGIAGAITMSNEHCVFINATVESTGLKLSAPAPGGVLIEFEE